MRELIVLLLGVASEYNDRADHDRFFTAVDAFNTVLKGEGYVERISNFGKYTDARFDPNAFNQAPRQEDKSPIIEEVVEKAKPREKPSTKKTPAIENSEIHL